MTTLPPVLVPLAVRDDVAGWLDVVGPVAFYLIVWGLVFAGTALFVGVVVPFLTGDSLLFGAGLVAGSTDSVNIWVLTIGVGLAAVAGDQVGFVLGRRYGRPYLARRGGRWVQGAVARTERFYTLFGWWSVVIGRYVPWARVFVPPVAGVAGMAYLRFLTANVFGALTWGVLITVVGYLAATDPAVRPVAYGVALAVVAASVVAGVRAWRQDRANPT
ncbi:DedA family protein [Antribacter gilvus]|uniref:DedA family protein n=1 Tax=Antribacter gilvus TaxID=2304675 RepID=UPI001F0B9323|nr:DedA family protein [Antribacter gilvus]